MGIAFPASAREWYAQEGATDILLSCGVVDESCPIEQMGEMPERDELNPRPAAFYDPAMLRFMCDNHGGVVYAIRLDGSADPPVYTWDDDQVWIRQGDTFSRYLFIIVWSGLADQAAFHRAAFSGPLASSDLGLLGEELDEVPPALRDSPVRRFERDDQRLVIAPFSVATLHWYLSAETAGGMEALVRTVWRRSDMRASP